MSERVKAGYRVDSAILDDYKHAIQQKHGKLRPYAGVKLEDELRAVVDEGDISSLWGAVDDLSDALPVESQREKNPEGMTLSGERRKCQLRISEETKTAVNDFVNDQGASVRSCGRLLDRVMWSYVNGGSALERITERVEACEDAVRSMRDVDELDAVQKRVRIIDEYLSDVGFTLDDFDEVVDEEVPGISATEHVREKYLPKVLDEKEMTWHPAKAGLFVDPDSQDIDESRDPRSKPKVLRDEEDEKLAIMCDAYDADLSSSITGTITKSEAAELLRASHQRVGSMMRDIGEMTHGYQYVETRDVLACNSAEVMDMDVLDVVEGNAGGTDGSLRRTDGDAERVEVGD